MATGTQTNRARIAVTGVGLVSALGPDAATSWRRLAAGESGVRPVTLFDVSGLDVTDGCEAASLGRDPEARDRAIEGVRRAVREAVRDAGHGPDDPARVVVIGGSSLAASASSEAFWRGFLERGPAGAPWERLGSYDPEETLAILAGEAGAEGEAWLVSSACAAGVSAVSVAADLVELGRADRAIVAGWDSLDIHTFAGFHALKALAAGEVRPMTRGRSGMKLGDGFAAIVLDRHPRRPPRCWLAGWGESADAHHLTHPHPEGKGAALAMERALEKAAIGSAQIDYVNLHATATPANDVAEYRALRRVFGERLASIPLGAFKSAIGHTLGGAGTVEAVLTILALEDQRLPPTLGAGPLEEEMGTLDLVAAGRAHRMRFAMSNAFGFGGANGSLVFEAASRDG